MEKDSALYQLMDTRMHSVMNGIVSSDGEYQAILRKSDVYSGELERMDLSKEIRLLIDRYVSEQNALGSRYGISAALLIVPSGSSNTAWRTFCAIVCIFQSCTSGARQTPSMLRPFLSLAEMVPVRVWS